MLKPGDLVFFAGRDLVSAAIQLGTFSLPRRGFSHVAIVGELHNAPLLYESTSYPRGDCVRSGKPVIGVQAHWPEDVIKPGMKVFHVPLRSELYTDERERLTATLDRCIGKSYDLIGAVRSGGFLLRTVCGWLHPESDADLYCSELAALALTEIERMHVKNYSSWSPMRLYRRVRNQGICDTARRLTFDDCSNSDSAVSVLPREPGSLRRVRTISSSLSA